MDNRIRWGILGDSRIGKKQMIPAMGQAANSTFYAIASRHMDEAAHPGVRCYPSYEALLADPRVDAVYIPLPNALHCEWSVKAMEAGKHVLVEKPIAMDAAQCRRMMDAATRNRVLLMEAYMYRFSAKTQLLRGMLLQNRLGALRRVRAHFGYRKDFASDARDKKALGGGCLYDVGCYCVDFINWVMKQQGARFAACRAMRDMAGCEVDQGTSAILEYSTGAVASLDCWFNAASHQGAMLLGEEGSVYLDEAFRDTAEPALLRTAQGAEHTLPMPESRAYTAQVEAFANAILSGDASALVPLEDSLENMRVMDALFHSAQTL